MILESTRPQISPVDFENKENLIIQTNIDLKNKIIAADMNDLKRISNELAANMNNLRFVSESFVRDGQFPLDESSLFSSLEDARKYATGNTNDPDSRGLCHTSYPGQIIVVREDNDIDPYIINEDRELEDLALQSVPIGSFIPWWNKDKIPGKFMEHKGQFIDKIEYNDLYEVIGEQYGSTPTQFALPDQYKNLTEMKTMYPGVDEMLDAYFWIIRVR